MSRVVDEHLLVDGNTLSHWTPSLPDRARIMAIEMFTLAMPHKITETNAFADLQWQNMQAAA